MAAVSLYPDEKKPFCAIDVGCDHAKLSAYLIQSGICSHVYASDINQGPVEVARRNLKERSFNGKTLDNYIDVVQTDGLNGFEKIKAERIFILGMGGELIASILKDAEFVRTKENAGKIGFVLQPMTSEETLRQYLYTNGYKILDENLVLDKGRVYSVMLALYDGISRQTSRAGYLLGDINIQKRTELFERQLARRIRITKKAVNQLDTVGKCDNELSALLKELKSLEMHN